MSDDKSFNNQPTLGIRNPPKDDVTAGESIVELHLTANQTLRDSFRDCIPYQAPSGMIPVLNDVRESSARTDKKKENCHREHFTKVCENQLKFSERSSSAFISTAS